ncbi:MAG TPA: YceI family protein [Acidimicrobiales bacterium]|jgi:polyisoprenoid-binding protein YceI
MTQIVSDAPATRTVDGVQVPAAGTYALDVSHSHVGFAIRHLMVSKVRGQFDRFSGSITIGEDPTDSSVEVEIDLASVDTRDEKRDAHLRSSDFLHTDLHPTMTFRSTSVRRAKGDAWTVEGDLTLHGVTRPIELEVSYEGSATSPWGTTSIGFSATGKLNRDDFGVNWNQALEAGGFMLGKDVNLEIEAEAIAQ